MGNDKNFIHFSLISFLKEEYIYIDLIDANQ